MSKKKSKTSVLNNIVLKKAKNKHDAKDWPAAFVGAEYYTIRHFAKTHYISKNSLTSMLNHQLLTELKKLGNIGDKVNGYSVGYCAEVYAANKVLATSNVSINIKQIRFSPTIRPRTMQMLKYCSNCLTIFNVKN